MKIETHLDVGDMGTPIEMAGAIIKYYMKNIDGYMDENMYEFNRRQLTEIAEHILVYLEHSRYE